MQLSGELESRSVKLFALNAHATAAPARRVGFVFPESDECVS